MKDIAKQRKVPKASAAGIMDSIRDLQGRGFMSESRGAEYKQMDQQAADEGQHKTKIK